MNKCSTRSKHWPTETALCSKRPSEFGESYSGVKTGKPYPKTFKNYQTYFLNNQNYTYRTADKPRSGRYVMESEPKAQKTCE